MACWFSGAVVFMVADASMALVVQATIRCAWLWGFPAFALPFLGQEQEICSCCLQNKHHPLLFSHYCSSGLSCPIYTAWIILTSIAFRSHGGGRLGARACLHLELVNPSFLAAPWVPMMALDFTQFACWVYTAFAHSLKVCGHGIVWLMTAYASAGFSPCQNKRIIPWESLSHWAMSLRWLKVAM
jgi:hypothetical protein